MSWEELRGGTDAALQALRGAQRGGVVAAVEVQASLPRHSKRVCSRALLLK